MVASLEDKGVGLCASAHQPVIGHGLALGRGITLGKAALLTWTVPGEGFNCESSAVTIPNG